MGILSTITNPNLSPIRSFNLLISYCDMVTSVGKGFEVLFPNIRFYLGLGSLPFYTLLPNPCLQSLLFPFQDFVSSSWDGNMAPFIHNIMNMVTSQPTHHLLQSSPHVVFCLLK